MKTRCVLVVVWVTAFGLAACSGEGAGSAEVTTAPAETEVATTGTTGLAAPGQATTLPPTSTSTPASTPTTTTTVGAAPQWMWAWLQDPAQIVAISTEGRTNVLLDTPDPATINNSSMWQVAPDKAVAMYLDGGVLTAYLLTTTDATELAFPRVDMAVPENSWSLVALSGPHALIRYSYGLSEAAVLINSATAEATLLASNVADLNRPAMFSADGRYLRFVTTDRNGGTPSRVRERDFTTGRDRTLYSYSNFDHVFADATGDVWLDYRTGDVVAADGRATNGEGSSDPGTGRWLAGSWVMTYEFGCGADCPLKLMPVFGSDPPLTYLIPEKTVDRGLAGWVLDDSSLVVLDAGSSSYWRLTSDGGGEILGHGDPFQGFTALPDAPYAVISTDVGEPVTYQALLKVQTGEIIPLPMAAGPGDIWLENQPNGLLLTLFGSDDSQSAWVMAYDTGSFAALPADAVTYCNVLLADGSAACYSDASPPDGGVYRFEPLSGTLTKISDLMVYFLALQPNSVN